MIRKTDEENVVEWHNEKGEVVADWNDEACCDYPEDLTSYRDIGYLIQQVYKKGYEDGQSTK